LVEFVIFFPRLLLRLFVILDVGVVGPQMLQLSFVTEGAAQGEVDLLRLTLDKPSISGY